MGFLLGAWTKTMALQRMNDIHKKMSRIQAQIRRTHRDSEHMSKAIDREKKAALNALKYENYLANSSAQNSLMGTINDTLAGLGLTDVSQLKGDQQVQYNNTLQNAQMLMNQAIASANMTYEQKVASAEQYYDDMKTNITEPLADEEEDLKEENEHLKDQYQIAQQDYQAAQKMTEQDAKMLAPAYTGASA